MSLSHYKYYIVKSLPNQGQPSEMISIKTIESGFSYTSDDLTVSKPKISTICADMLNKIFYFQEAILYTAKPQIENYISAKSSLKYYPTVISLLAKSLNYLTPAQKCEPFFSCKICNSTFIVPEPVCLYCIKFNTRKKETFHAPTFDPSCMYGPKIIPWAYSPRTKYEREREEEKSGISRNELEFV